MNKEISQLIDSTLNGNQQSFCKRVWQQDHEIYKNRLKAISFEGMNRVLDAGCGFGQWLPSISELNTQVDALESDSERLNFARLVTGKLGFSNISFKIGSVVDTKYDDNTFDGIFSYSVIFCTDFRRVLKEFYRILKPGGKLYFNTNGIGWYLYNLLNSHNDTADFSSKDMAKTAFANTINYYATGNFTEGKYACVITPKEIVLSDLKEFGFVDAISGPEGTLLTNNAVKPVSFFKGEYEGLEGVTEYITFK